MSAISTSSAHCNYVLENYDVQDVMISGTTRATEMGIFVAVSLKNCISSKKIGYGKCDSDTYRIKERGQGPIVSVEKAIGAKIIN